MNNNEETRTKKSQPFDPNPKIINVSHTLTGLPYGNKQKDEEEYIRLQLFDEKLKKSKEKLQCREIGNKRKENKPLKSNFVCSNFLFMLKDCLGLL